MEWILLRKVVYVHEKCTPKQLKQILNVKTHLAIFDHQKVENGYYKEYPINQNVSYDPMPLRLIPPRMTGKYR